jgi:hypothetical protein
MSFRSSEGSTFVSSNNNALLPGAVGSIINGVVPAIVLGGSGLTIPVLPEPILLPKGVWILSVNVLIFTTIALMNGSAVAVGDNTNNSKYGLSGNFQGSTTGDAAMTPTYISYFNGTTDTIQVYVYGATSDASDFSVNAQNVISCVKIA